MTNCSLLLVKGDVWLLSSVGHRRGFFDAGLDPFRKPAAARVARPRAREFGVSLARETNWASFHRPVAPGLALCPPPRGDRGQAYAGFTRHRLALGCRSNSTSGSCCGGSTIAPRPVTGAHLASNGTFEPFVRIVLERGASPRIVSAPDERISAFPEGCEFFIPVFRFHVPTLSPCGSRAWLVSAPVGAAMCCREPSFTPFIYVTHVVGDVKGCEL